MESIVVSVPGSGFRSMSNRRNGLFERSDRFGLDREEVMKHLLVEGPAYATFWCDTAGTWFDLPGSRQQIPLRKELIREFH